VAQNRMSERKTLYLKKRISNNVSLFWFCKIVKWVFIINEYDTPFIFTLVEKRLDIWIAWPKFPSQSSCHHCFLGTKVPKVFGITLNSGKIHHCPNWTGEFFTFLHFPLNFLKGCWTPKLTLDYFSMKFYRAVEFPVKFISCGFYAK